MSSAVFYISGHGFGHASRELEVIHAVAARRPDWSIVLRTAVSPSLLERSLRVPYTLLPGPCDTGVVQVDSVTNDDGATAREAIAFYSAMDAHVEAECAALAGHDVRVVVGDIPPLAFEVAAKLRVPSVAIANFTWDWIYEWHDDIRAAPGVIDRIRHGYRQATIALRLPFSPELDVFPRVDALPLIARIPSASRASTRQALGIDPTRTVALLSFGGYGLQRLDIAGLDCLDDWTVLLTDRIASGASPSSSVMFLPESLFASGFRYEDLVAASDVVVTKPGYGILSECATAGTAVLYTSRGTFREYDVLVAQMPRVLRCRFLSQDALFAGQWNLALESLLAQPRPPERMEPTGAERAADVICGL